MEQSPQYAIILMDMTYPTGLNLKKDEIRKCSPDLEGWVTFKDPAYGTHYLIVSNYEVVDARILSPLELLALQVEE